MTCISKIFRTFTSPTSPQKALYVTTEKKFFISISLRTFRWFGNVPKYISTQEVCCISSVLLYRLLLLAFISRQICSLSKNHILSVPRSFVIPYPSGVYPKKMFRVLFCRDVSLLLVRPLFPKTAGLRWSDVW